MVHRMMTPIVVHQPNSNGSARRSDSSFRWIINTRYSNTVLLLLLFSLREIQRGSAFTSVQPRIPSNSFSCLLQSPVSSSSSISSITQLYAQSSKLEPLVQSGDWSAYLDEDRTGLIYYFNSRTGESLWEPPTPDFPIVSLTPALRAKAQMKQNEYVQQIESEQVQRQQAKLQQEQQQKLQQQQQQQQKKETKKNRFFLSLLSDDEEDEEQKATSSATKQVQKKKETTDWFNSVVQDVIQKQPSDSATTSKRSFEQDRQALGDRLKNDFFDKMFSSGKNAVTGMTNAISSTVGDIATLTSSTNSAVAKDSSITTPTTEEEAAAATATATSSTTITPEPITKQPEPKIATKTTTTTTPTTVIPAPAIVVPETRTVEVVSLVLPHPEKVRWGGEDAVFVNGRTFGLFDGVSGAEKRDGIPLYSKTLANYMKQQSKSYQSIGMTIPEMSNLLLSAAEYADEKATGASTAIVASITSDGFLRVLSVGDSRCILVRNGNVIAKSREISHYFECPYQLSVDSPDRPKDGTKLNIELQKNDIIIMASDGVFDNLSEDRIIEIINEISSTTASNSNNNNNAAVRKNQLQKIAKRIVDVSRKVSFDTKAITPYAKLAKRNNQPEYSDGLGGKIDDISCIVARYE